MAQQNSITPYLLSSLLRSGSPIAYNLLAGNNITSGNIGSLGGSLGGTLGGYLGGPYGGLAGRYGGNVLGNVIGGGQLGQSAISGIPSLGTGLLNLLLPQELQGFGSVAAPLTTSLLQLGGNALGQGVGLGSNILGNVAGWGGAASSNAGAGLTGLLGTIGNYAGPIGMIGSAILNVVNDISAGNDVDRALRKIEGSVINAFSPFDAATSGNLGAAPAMTALYNQLLQYIPEASRNQPWIEQMSSLPEWAQPLLAGGQGLQNDVYFSNNPLMLFTSPAMQTFSDSQLTQQLVSGLFSGLQNPSSVNFSQWEALTPEQKMKIYKQVGGGPEGQFTGLRSQIPPTEDVRPNPISAQEWAQLSQAVGSQSALDPFQIFGGLYQQLYNLNQAMPGEPVGGPEKNPVGSSGNIRQANYQIPFISQGGSWDTAPKITTANDIFQTLSAMGFYGGGSSPISAQQELLNSPDWQKILNDIYNTTYGLPNVETYQNAFKSLGAAMGTLGTFGESLNQKNAPLLGAGGQTLGTRGQTWDWYDPYNSTPYNYTLDPYYGQKLGPSIR